MTLTEAANRLRNLAESFHAGLVEGSDGQWSISTTEMEAVTHAAAVLGMFVEASQGSSSI